MTKYAKKMTEEDNVVSAVVECRAGDEVTIKFKGIETRCTCSQDVPFGHKIAITDIPKGSKIIKYGEQIGTASLDIMKGDWVHTHNVKDEYKCLGKNGHPLPGQEDGY